MEEARDRAFAVFAVKPPFIMFCTIRLAIALAASVNTELFSVASAAMGVLEIFRFTQVTLLSGQSKVMRFGCGDVRLKKVYKPRRYRSSPLLTAHLKLLA